MPTLTSIEVPARVLSMGQIELFNHLDESEKITYVKLNCQYYIANETMSVRSQQLKSLNFEQTKD